MKRIFRVIIIVILIIAAVAGSAWLFYSKYQEERDSYDVALAFQNSSSRLEFNSLMENANDVSNCDRFEDIVTTIEELDAINNILTPYLSKAGDYEVNQNHIYNQLQDVIDMHPDLTKMFNEYIQKATKVQTFDKNSGANPVFEDLAKYVVEYSEYLSAINSELNNVVSHEADMKFSVIDVYLKVSIHTFSNVEEKSGVTVLTSKANLNKANSWFNFDEFYIGDFSTNSTKFINNYKNCNKEEFAISFNEKATSVSSLNGEANNDAMYYLKAVLGV